MHMTSNYLSKLVIVMPWLRYFPIFNKKFLQFDKIISKQFLFFDRQILNRINANDYENNCADNFVAAFLQKIYLNKLQSSNHNNLDIKYFT